ncbi:hypothetical protein CTAYLR_003842 [Chrysophaeum taylorii]|uniref:N-acetyltransferase domain-containing protein n=1 Tax=Chrysophaeum taylorii TaxID=2483200 RepID=A0AAD7XKR0_9STRA|nr:hypothetical protein CTAYLR_003842 [Chrysophaeum taylorii]
MLAARKVIEWGGGRMRRMEIGDAGRVAAMTAKLFEGSDIIASNFSSWVRKCEFWGEIVDEEVAGFINLRVFDEKRAIIESLRVDPKYRGLGIGHRLTQFAYDYVAPSSPRVDSVWSVCDSTNKTMCKVMPTVRAPVVARFECLRAVQAPRGAGTGLASSGNRYETPLGIFVLHWIPYRVAAIEAIEEPTHSVHGREPGSFSVASVVPTGLGPTLTVFVCCRDEDQFAAFLGAHYDWALGLHPDDLASSYEVMYVHPTEQHPPAWLKPLSLDILGSDKWYGANVHRRNVS